VAIRIGSWKCLPLAAATSITRSEGRHDGIAKIKRSRKSLHLSAETCRSQSKTLAEPASPDIRVNGQQEVLVMEVLSIPGIHYRMGIL
jgi:hypothetical protein